MSHNYLRIGQFKEVGAFKQYVRHLNLPLPVDERILSAAAGSPLAQPLELRTAGGRMVRIGNRWCIHPMEGWDGTPDGKPTVHTIRRWQRFGLSGAKLIWGGEAVAVRHDGRANPHQLFYHPDNVEPVRQLLQSLTEAHRQAFGNNALDDLVVGLQLTHSGRFCRPNDKQRLEPRIVYRHPLLDRRCGIRDDGPVLRDDEIKRLVDDYVAAAKMAQAIGFHFVDIKHCHGYLGHEFLSAFERPGPFGGDLEGRTRFLHLTIQAIRAACPGLMIGVRLSAFDTLPYRPDPAQTTPEKLGPGVPEEYEVEKFGPYPGFGCRRDNPLEIDLTEPIALLKMLRDWGTDLINLSAGSPYYNPHIQRPAYYPPSDGYQPPEDPIMGCFRQIDVARRLKAAVPELVMVGSAYTYFQEYLPHVAQAVVRSGWIDVVGIGRMVLAYPDLPADCLTYGELRRPKLICRTFSDCTTGPRNGLISGCYPLDEYYKKSPESEALKAAKQTLRQKMRSVGSN